MICENVGSRVEVRLDESYGAQHEDWAQYLCLPKDGLVGHGYISSLVTRLKFELGMFVGLIVAVPAIVVLVLLKALALITAGALLTIAAIGIFYFRNEAIASVQRLAETRQAMTTKSRAT